MLPDSLRFVLVLGAAAVPWACGGGRFTSAPNDVAGRAEIAGASGIGGGNVAAVGGTGDGPDKVPATGGAITAAGGDAGSKAESAGEAGAELGGESGTADRVGVFVAQGYEGRLTRSCDDGRTFPFNQSEDDAFRCFSDEEHNCDDSEFAGVGLAFGAGAFVASWGYGHPGRLQRSTDGKEWRDVMTGTPPFLGLAYGNSVFVAGGDPTSISSDGKTWSRGGQLTFDFNNRGLEFVPTHGGTFIVTGESGDQRAISTSNDGKVWKAANDLPALCAQDLFGMAGSDSVMLVASEEGHVCWSADGETWTDVPVSDKFTSPPLWTGKEFWIYSGSELFKSKDAQSWTSVTIEPANIAIGPLARSPEGTLVAANADWRAWYEEQHFFRSTDGVHWDSLPMTAFTGSHPITFIRFGYLPPTPGCGR